MRKHCGNSFAFGAVITTWFDRGFTTVAEGGECRLSGSPIEQISLRSLLDNQVNVKNWPFSL